jgi:ATP-dependent Clp protease ATP-binding subunit ClpB
MTSNIAEEDLPRRFRPEFLNRIDDIIVFHSLELPQIKRIIEIQLKRLGKLVSDRGLTIEISDHAKEILAQKGYDPAFGARPLKRTLQKQIIDPLAINLLEGNFKPGDTVFVNATPDGKVDLSLEPELTTVN